MTAAIGKSSDEAQIRQLMDNWADALRAKDVNRMMSNYSPDVLVYGVTPPLQYRGAIEYRKKWEEMFNSLKGVIGYEVRDLTITTRGDIAFSHCLSRISERVNYENANLPWIRVTLCLQKIDGRWMVTHEHASMPFDVQTGKASVDLKP